MLVTDRDWTEVAEGEGSLILPPNSQLPRCQQLPGRQRHTSSAPDDWADIGRRIALSLASDLREQPWAWLLFGYDVAQHLGAGLRHGGIRLGVSGQGCPTTLANVGAFFP